MSRGKFLKAEWRKLLLVNYAIDPAILTPYLPAHTTIDTWNNKCYGSLVGFMFLNTRVQGIGFPFHKNFCEINLRFYVKYNGDGTWQRGVVFIKEFVPRSMVAFIANTFFKEHYAALPMRHNWEEKDKSLSIKYSWKTGKWNSMEVQTANTPVEISEGSEEEFITEHYYGYSKFSDTVSTEYKVEHPKWTVYPVEDYTMDVDFDKCYGRTWGFLNQAVPQSVFLAEGSVVSVGWKRKIA